MFRALLRLFLTIPVTTASSVRTFSAMRRLKNYFRSSMTQERLNHILLLHCHKTRSDRIDIHHIASSFISVNERRQQFFGSYHHNIIVLLFVVRKEFQTGIITNFIIPFAVS